MDCGNKRDSWRVYHDAEQKKRKRGFRKCSKCGDSGHNAPKCENPQYYEALARKEEMLDHVDYAIKEFTQDAKEYSLNREYDMAKMKREDATDMRKLKRMIENNHFGKAWRFAFDLDSAPREYAPNALWDIWDAESFEAEGELERQYFTRFGDERGGKEWGEYKFTWFSNVIDWMPIDEDTTGWNDWDFDDFRVEKEYDLVYDMLSDSDSDLYGWIENHERGDRRELHTSYEVLNDEGEKETLVLVISWGEPENVEQKIQYYKKEPLNKLEFLAESFSDSCEDRMNRLEKMLKGQGVWYSNPTQEQQVAYLMREHGLSEKEAIINCEYNDELFTTIGYLLDYAHEGGHPTIKGYEDFEAEFGSEDDGENDNRLLNEIIKDVFKEFKIKTFSPRWGSGLNHWHIPILESQPKDGEDDVYIAHQSRQYDCYFDGKGKCFEIPNFAISDRRAHRGEWFGSHFSSIKYVSDSDYGMWNYAPTEDTKDKLKAYQEKLRKKYNLPIELFVKETYHENEYGYEPSLIMGVSLGKSVKAAEEPPEKDDPLESWMEEDYHAEDPSVYWWTKGAIMEKVKDRDLTEEDSVQIIEMVAANAPMDSITKGMSEAEQ